MSWQSYVDNLMADGSCQDAAIVGYLHGKYVWASYAGGTFANMTVSRILFVTVHFVKLDRCRFNAFQIFGLSGQALKKRRLVWYTWYPVVTHKMHWHKWHFAFAARLFFF